MKLARVIDPIPNWEMDNVKKGDIVSLIKINTGSYYFLHLRTNNHLSGIDINENGVGRGSGKKKN